MENEKLYSMNAGAKPELFRFAARLRLEMTEPEKKIWTFLKDNPSGLKFRRQHPFYIYIFDFYCHKAKLAIEIDGGYHDLPKQKTLDIERTDRIREMGISELRFTNENVINQFDMVCESIINSCNNIIAKDR